MNIAIITARGGSKGLPRKNILTLNEYPLIYWTIKAALQANSIDKVFVSTEDEEISKISKAYGANVIKRPMELARDESSSEEVLIHSIDYLLHKNQPINNIFLLQPTSPLRNSTHIDDAFSLYTEKLADCVISVFEGTEHAAKAFKENKDGSIIGLYSIDAPYSRRQDLPKTFHPNGAIYIFPAIKFMREREIPRKNVYPFIMNQAESIDIDSADDLNQAELLIKKGKLYV